MTLKFLSSFFVHKKQKCKMRIQDSHHMQKYLLSIYASMNNNSILDWSLVYAKRWTTASVTTWIYNIRTIQQVHKVALSSIIPYPALCSSLDSSDNSILNRISPNSISSLSNVELVRKEKKLRSVIRKIITLAV